MATHTIKVWTNVDPTTSILNVKYEADTFYADVSDIIYSTGITIGQPSLNVLGYENCALNQLSGESDSATTNLIISAGAASGNVSGNFGMTTNTVEYKFTGNLTVNGVSRYDGETFTIGNTSVTLYFPSSCISYID